MATFETITYAYGNQMVSTAEHSTKDEGYDDKIRNMHIAHTQRCIRTIHIESNAF